MYIYILQSLQISLSSSISQSTASKSAIAEAAKRKRIVAKFMHEGRKYSGALPEKSTRFRKLFPETSSSYEQKSCEIIHILNPFTRYLLYEIVDFGV